MNYIELINNFWRLNKESSFTPNEKAVYFALLNKCNELMWKNPFTQSNAYLSLDSGMSEPAMMRARNMLQQKELINFVSGKKKRELTLYTLGKIKISLISSINDSKSNSIISSINDSTISKNGLDIGKRKTKIKTKIKQDSTTDSKIEVFERVFFKETEIEKLKMDFGEDYDDAIKILSNYKCSKNVNYDSDYHAMHGWVKNRIRENKERHNSKNVKNDTIKKINPGTGFGGSL